MRPVALMGISTMVFLLLTSGCDMFQEKVATTSGASTGTFEGTADLIKKESQAVVLPGDGKSRVLVSPRLQGRILTLKVGSAESTVICGKRAERVHHADRCHLSVTEKHEWTAVTIRKAVQLRAAKIKAGLESVARPNPCE